MLLFVFIHHTHMRNHFPQAETNFLDLPFTRNHCTLGRNWNNAGAPDQESEAYEYYAMSTALADTGSYLFTQKYSVVEAGIPCAEHCCSSCKLESPARLFRQPSLWHSSYTLCWIGINDLEQIPWDTELDFAQSYSTLISCFYSRVNRTLACIFCSITWGKSILRS